MGGCGGSLGMVIHVQRRHLLGVSLNAKHVRYSLNNRLLCTNPFLARVCGIIRLGWVWKASSPKGWIFSSRRVCFIGTTCTQTNLTKNATFVPNNLSYQMHDKGYDDNGISRKTRSNRQQLKQSDQAAPYRCCVLRSLFSGQTLWQLPSSTFRNFSTWKFTDARCNLQLLTECVEREAYLRSAVCPVFWAKISSACSAIELSSSGELSVYNCSRRLRELVRHCVRLSCALRACNSTGALETLGLESLHRMVCLLERLLLAVIAEVNLIFAFGRRSNVGKSPAPLSAIELGGFVKGYTYAREATSTLCATESTGQEVLGLLGDNAMHHYAEDNIPHALNRASKTCNRIASGVPWLSQICDLYEEALAGVLLKELGALHPTFLAGNGRGSYSQTLNSVRFSCAATAKPLSSSYAVKATLTLQGLLQILSSFSPGSSRAERNCLRHEQNAAGSKQGLQYLRVPHSLLQLLERMIWERRGDFEVEPIPDDLSVVTLKPSERGGFITSWNEEQANSSAELAEVEQLVFAARVLADYEHSELPLEHPPFQLAFRSIGDALIPMVDVLLTADLFAAKQQVGLEATAVPVGIRDPLCDRTNRAHPAYFTEEWLLFPWLREDSSSFLVLQLLGSFAKAGICHQRLFSAICWGLVKPLPMEPLTGQSSCMMYCLLDKWSTESVCCCINQLCTSNYEVGHFLRFFFTHYAPPARNCGVKEATGRGNSSKFQDTFFPEDLSTLRLFKKQQSTVKRLLQRQPWHFYIRNSQLKSSLRNDYAARIHYVAFPSHIRALSLEAKKATDRLIRWQTTVISTGEALAASRILAENAAVDEIDYLDQYKMSVAGDQRNSWMLLPVHWTSLRRLISMISYTRNARLPRLERSFDYCTLGSIASLFNAVAASSCIPPSPQWIETLIRQVHRLDGCENIYLEHFIHALPYLPPMSAMRLVSGINTGLQECNKLRRGVIPQPRTFALSSLSKGAIMTLPTAQLPELLIGILLHTPLSMQFWRQARISENCNSSGTGGVQRRIPRNLFSGDAGTTIIGFDIPALAFTIKVVLRRMLHIWANIISATGMADPCKLVVATELLNTLSKVPDFTSPGHSLLDVFERKCRGEFSVISRMSSADLTRGSCRQLMIGMLLCVYRWNAHVSGDENVGSREKRDYSMKRRLGRWEIENSPRVALQSLKLGLLRELYATFSVIAAIMSMGQNIYSVGASHKTKQMPSRAGSSYQKLRGIKEPSGACDNSRPTEEADRGLNLGQEQSINECTDVSNASFNESQMRKAHGIHSSKFQRQVLSTVEVCSDTLDCYFSQRMVKNDKYDCDSGCSILLPKQRSGSNPGSECSAQWKITTEAPADPYFIDILIERRE